MLTTRRSTPSLRRELLLSTAILFVAALLIAVAAAAVTLPLLRSPGRAALFIAVLVAVDLSVLFIFLRGLVQRTLLTPLEQIAADAERIAGGDYGHRIEGGDTEELARLTWSLNTMAERLISEQNRLALSVQELDRTHQELVQTTDDLVRSARMASVGTLAAGLAHEVGNPLGALVGYLEVAKRRALSGGEVGLPVESALEEAARIDRIVRSVLDFADPGGDGRRLAGGLGGAIGSSSLQEAIGQTLHLLEGRGALEGVRVRRDLAAGPHLVSGRMQHLEQILMNVLMNALRAAREGGKAPEIEVRLYSQGVHPGQWGREAILEVADNGPGISPDLIERIFDPFFTTRPPGEGTGLGLAITRRIVRELGGRIEAYSRKEGGALFRVSLPLAGDDVGIKGGMG